jgi:hypothetical protein
MGSSQFLLRTCPQDRFVMALAPGHAHLLAIKILYILTVFWLRSNLYRDTAPVLLSNFVTGDKFAAAIKLCIATRVMLNKLCTWMAKTAPYPPCTVTTFWLKYLDPARCLRRVTPTKLYRRAVRWHRCSMIESSSPN